MLLGRAFFNLRGKPFPHIFLFKKKQTVPGGMLTGRAFFQFAGQRGVAPQSEQLGRIYFRAALFYFRKYIFP